MTEPRTADASGPIAWALALALLVGLYGPSLADHVRLALDPLVMNDDARQQIPPLYRIEDPALFPDDFISDYYHAIYPVGWKLTFGALARASSVEAASVWGGYALLLATLVLTALTASRLAGVPAAAGALALCLGSHVVVQLHMGGLPHAAALPLLAGCAAALARGRAVWLLALVAVGAGFYPSAAIVGGLAAALWLLAFPAADRGDAAAWSLRRRLLALAASGAVALVLVLPPGLAARPYGALIGPTEWGEFPEAGRDGRWSIRDVGPDQGLGVASAAIARRLVIRTGAPWAPGLRAGYVDAARPGAFTDRQKLGLALLALWTAIGWLGLARRDPAARRLLALLAAAAIGHTAARLVAPHLYFPSRYLYPVGLLFLIWLPSAAAGWVALASRGAARPGLRPAAVAAASALLVLVLGGRVAPEAGLETGARGSGAVLDALADTPVDALIAGWPEGLMDFVPYVARRRILVSYETHQSLHRDYVLELRRRTEALIDAYWATSPEPLRALRDRFGVTHLVVDRRHLQGPPPRYFAPFDAHVEAASARAGGGEPAVLRQLRGAAVFDDGQVAILELARLAEP